MICYCFFLYLLNFEWNLHVLPRTNPLVSSDQLCCRVFWMRRCKEALCLIDCVRHWFGFPGRLFHSRRCCDAGCRALQQRLHAPWLVLFHLHRPNLCISIHSYSHYFVCCDFITPVKLSWSIASFSFTLPITNLVIKDVLNSSLPFRAQIRSSRSVCPTR